MPAVYTLATSGANTDIPGGRARVTVHGLRRGLLSLLVLVVAMGLAMVADRPVPIAADLSSPPQQAPATTSVAAASTSPVTAPAQPVSCPEWTDGTPPTEAAPVVAKLSAYLLDPRLQGNDVSVSAWIDGIGEVASLNGDERLNVASNQKLLTA